MNDFKITVLESQTLVADSRDIAKELGIDHHNLMQTVKTHQTDIEANFGCVLFQTDDIQMPKGGTRKETTHALLTEDQFIFIVTLSRNTAKVVQVKAKLVKAFSLAKQALRELSNNAPKPSRTVPASSNPAMDSMVTQIVHSLNEATSQVSTVDHLIALSANLSIFIRRYKELQTKEQEVKELKTQWHYQFKTAKANLHDAVYQIAMQYITVRTPSPVLIPCNEFSHKCVALDIQPERFAEVYKAMASLGFEHKEVSNRTYWYLA